MKLTWKEIKAHPKKSLQYIKSLDHYLGKYRGISRQNAALIDDKAELIDYAKRLESELYDLKKHFELPRDEGFRPVCMNQE